MFDQLESDDLFGMSSALEALHELGKNTDQAMLLQRASERLDIQVHLQVQTRKFEPATSVRDRRDYRGHLQWRMHGTSFTPLVGGRYVLARF